MDILCHSCTKFGNVLFKPHSLFFGIFGFLVIANGYVMRNGLHYIKGQNVQCVQNSKFFSSKFFTLKWWWCRNYKENVNVDECCHGVPNDSFDFQHFRGLMMLSFYVGYAVSQLTGFMFLRCFGGKWNMISSLTLTAILTAITPYVLDVGGIKVFLCLRFLLGITEGHCLTSFESLRSPNLPNSILFSKFGYIRVLFISLLATYFATCMEESETFSYVTGSCSILMYIGYTIFFFYKSESLEQNVVPSSEDILQSDESFWISNYPLSDYPDVWWNNPTILTALTFILQHEWTQSLIISEIHQLMNDLNGPGQGPFRLRTIWLKIVAPLLATWILAIITNIFGNTMVMMDIFSPTEAANLRYIVSSFGPKITADVISCLISTDNNSVSTACTCAFGVISTYMGMKMHSMYAENTNTGTWMNIANNMGSLMTLVSPYMEQLARSEGSLQCGGSFIGSLCSLLSNKPSLPPDNAIPN